MKNFLIFVICILIVTSSSFAQPPTNVDFEKDVVEKLTAYYSNIIVAAKIDKNWLREQSVSQKLNGSPLLLASQGKYIVVNTGYYRMKRIDANSVIENDTAIYVSGNLEVTYVRKTELFITRIARKYYESHFLILKPCTYTDKEFKVQFPFSYTHSGVLLGPLANTPVGIPELPMGFTILSDRGQY